MPGRWLPSSAPTGRQEHFPESADRHGGVPREAVRYADEDIGGLRPGAIVRRGLTMVPEAAGSSEPERGREPADRRLRPTPGAMGLMRLYALFPILADKRRLPATQLSGGQQQMVAIGAR